MSKEQTITEETMEVTVGPLTLRGAILRDALLAKVTDQKEYRGTFIICMAQTKASKNLPFTLFSAAPEDDAFQLTYQAFLELPLGFVTNWVNAAMAMNSTELDEKKR